MFYYLYGTLAYTDLNHAVIDCTGVGYQLTVSGTTLGKLAGKLNTAVKLYTSMTVREDAVELFGFYDLTEKAAFEMLIGVSGIGPKAAVSILTQLSPEQLSAAIKNEDTAAISRANGVGSKTAARVILELRDKIGKQIPSDGESDGAVSSVTDSGSFADAMSTLLVLGYSRPEASAALRSLDTKGKSVEEIIRLALRKLGN